MIKNLFTFTVLAACCALTSCSAWFEQTYEVEMRGDSIIVTPSKNEPYTAFAYILLDNDTVPSHLFENQKDSIVGEHTIKNKCYNFDKIALYALKNNNNIPLSVFVNNKLIKTLNYTISPYFEPDENTQISGNCSPLQNKYTKEYTCKQTDEFLIRERERLSEKEKETYYGLRNAMQFFQCKKTNHYYCYNQKIPHVKDFDTEYYSINTDIQADYYVLYAVSEFESFYTIESIVADIIANDYNIATQNTEKPMKCYHDNRYSGVKCISLISINRDWTFNITPLAIALYDKSKPIVNEDNWEIHFDVTYLNQYTVGLARSSEELRGNQVARGYVNIFVDNYSGNGIICNVTFDITARGDVKSITIVRNKRLSYYGYYANNYPPERHKINLDDVTTIMWFSHRFWYNYQLHFENGDNFIPIEVEDWHGNITETTLVVNAKFVRQADISIENNW